MWNEICRPRYFARLQPAGHETFAAMIDQDLFDQELVGLRGSCRKGERDLAEAELEQAIAATAGSSSRVSGSPAPESRSADR